MHNLAQIFAVTAMNLRSIPLRLGNSLVIVIGMAGVVAVLVSIFSMSAGFRETLIGDARADRAIVLTRDAESEATSSLSRENAASIQEAQGIARDPDGAPIVSPEVLLVVPVSRKSDRSDVNVTLRGVGQHHFKLRPELKLTAGRPFRPGMQELLVGESAQRQFAGLDLGNQLRLPEGDWTIVGVFASGKGAHDSELIADVQTVMSAYKLKAFNTMTVLLVSPQSIDAFKALVAGDPALYAEVRNEPEYLAAASGPINRMLELVAYVIGSIMAVGALFAALNSMHAAVSARSVEIATLRAIGYGAGVVVAAVLLEALLLALSGAIIGLVIADAAFDDRTISTLGGAVWDSQLVYSLNVTPALALSAVLLACAVGLLGAVVPALRAAQLSIADALRAN